MDFASVIRRGIFWAGTLLCFGAGAICLAGERSGPAAARLELGSGVLLSPSGNDEPCGELVMNADGSYETGYSWQYGGVVPPMYGALAECYQGAVTLCSVDFDFCSIGIEPGRIDVYAWDDLAGSPGNVICAHANVNPGPVAFWPNFSRLRVSMESCCTGDAWWVGYWGDWPGQMSALYVAADLNGAGGCPKTLIAPSIGYPTGWQSVDLAWGSTAAIGIGGEVLPCAPVAVKRSTWGGVKSLYR